MSEENVELARAALNWFAQLDEGLVAPEGVSQYFAQDPTTTLSGFMEEGLIERADFYATPERAHEAVGLRE